jgi:hypothetical protein
MEECSCRVCIHITFTFTSSTTVYTYTREVLHSPVTLHLLLHMRCPNNDPASKPLLGGPSSQHGIMGASMLASTTRHEAFSDYRTVASYQPRKTLVQNESERVPPVSQTLIRLAKHPITLWPPRRRQAICCHCTLPMHPRPMKARVNPHCEPHRCCHVACMCCLYDLLWGPAIASIGHN